MATLHDPAQQAVQASQANPGQQIRPGALFGRWVLAHILIIDAAWALALFLLPIAYCFGGLVLAALVVGAPLAAQWVGIRPALQSQRDASLWLGATALAFVGT